MTLTVVMIGDIVGKPGRRVVQQQLPVIRERYAPDLVLANAENVAGGSGITPQLYQRLTAYGLDGLTLGDHAYRQRDIVPDMAQYERLIRPANLPAAAAGNTVLRLAPPGGGPELHVTTLLGRVFMTGGPTGDDPFAAADRFIDAVAVAGPALIEIHAETTAEKIALAHHVDGRVAAVVGTHTHVPTADARVLPGGTAFMTDLGMTGPYDSVLGRRKDRVVQFMSTGMPAPFDVAEGDIRLCGVVIEIDGSGRATRCERIELPAEMDRPPFAEG